MLPHLIPIGALFAGVALLLLGIGLTNTLLALRGSLEGFSNETLGVIASCYFLGFFVGTYIAPALIRGMGHVRAFAFFAAAAAVCVLMHSLVIHAWFWMLLRVVTGIALLGFYTVIESWLNSEAPSERRGQIFSVYMATNLFALAAAQQFLHLDSPAEFTLFVLAGIFVVMALMPVVATRLPPPALTSTPRLSLPELWRAAPAAYFGAVVSGVGMGAFWGMGAVYAGRLGLDESGVALFITTAIVAGGLLQWPVGHLSDKMDRRRALAIIGALAAVGGVLTALLGPVGTPVLLGIAVFGAGAFSVYPVVVAHLIDHLRREEILSGNAGLLLLHGVGAAAGPAIVGLLMGWFGAVALPLFFTVCFGSIATFALLYSRRVVEDQIVEEPAHFMPMLRTSPTVLEMMTPEPAASGAEPAGASAEREERFAEQAGEPEILDAEPTETEVSRRAAGTP